MRNPSSREEIRPLAEGLSEIQIYLIISADPA